MPLRIGKTVPVQVSLDIDKSCVRGMVNVSGSEKLCICPDSLPFKGTLRLQADKEVVLKEVRVAIIGRLYINNDKTNQGILIKRQLNLIPKPVSIVRISDFSFEFPQFPRKFESYYGDGAKIRYFLVATISRQKGGDLDEKKEFISQHFTTPPDVNFPVCTELSVCDGAIMCDIEIEKSIYSTNGVIIARVYFLSCDLDVEAMYLTVETRERILLKNSSNVPVNGDCEQDEKRNAIGVFEVMDGTPVKGCSIPIRIFLGGLSIGSTMPNIDNKLSICHFLTLTLVDRAGHKFYRSIPINIIRTELVE